MATDRNYAMKRVECVRWEGVRHENRIVLQRDNIGAAKDGAVLQQELDSWLRSLVTEMKNPGPELVACHSLCRAAVNVEPNPENPGFFRVSLTIVSHFQVEGFDVNLSLVGQMPTARST